MTIKPKIIVLDDDPTGSQTVHSCLLLTKWDVETLILGLQEESPIFFVLTNTRALPKDEAEIVTREVCRHLKEAIAITQIKDFLIVSRSDSTLRGHYPIETDVIGAEIGPFDAHFLIPAFFEGGELPVIVSIISILMVFPHQYMKPNLPVIQFLLTITATYQIMSKKKLIGGFWQIM